MTVAQGPSRERDEVTTAVVIPAGPRDDIVDTLESVLWFVPRPRLVVVVNDTATSLVERLADADPDVIVIPPPANLRSGTTGGLWRKVSHALEVVLAHGAFDVVIRMDADALFTGAGLEAMAARRFARDPSIGILGAYRMGPNGSARDWKPAASCLSKEMGLRGLRHPRLRSTLRCLVEAAIPNGYELGAHALGTSVLNGAVLEAWAERGWLGRSALVESRLCDDMIAGLLTFAAGFTIGDMSGPSDPMAISWRGLFAPPCSLLSAGKTLVHSVRSCGDLGEREIRAAFRRARLAMPKVAEQPRPRGVR